MIDEYRNTDNTLLTRKSRLWAFVIGAGLALAPIHNQYLTKLATLDNGEVVFFLPTVGFLLTFLGLIFFLPNNWDRIKEAGLGDKRIWIPLLVIVTAMGLSGFSAHSGAIGLQDRFAPLGMGIMLFGLYIAARVLGRDILLPVVLGAIVTSLGVLAYSVVYPGTVSGGFVFEGNYDIVVGYTMLGAAVYFGKYRLALVVLVLAAVLLTGSPEGVFVLAVVGVAVLIRRDWSRRLAIIILVAVVVPAILLVSTGHGKALYGYVGSIIGDTANSLRVEDTRDDGSRSAIGYRIFVISNALSDIRPLGTGYSATEFREGIVHNVPLVLVQQLGYPGILAGLVWLWVSVWGLCRTRWTYAWLLVLALSVFDHFVWTQIGAWWWVIAGVSFADRNYPVSDMLFAGPPFAAITAPEDTSLEQMPEQVRERYRRMCDLMEGHL